MSDLNKLAMRADKACAEYRCAVAEQFPIGATVRVMNGQFAFEGVIGGITSSGSVRVNRGRNASLWSHRHLALVNAVELVGCDCE